MNYSGQTIIHYSGIQKAVMVILLIIFSAACSTPAANGDTEGSQAARLKFESSSQENTTTSARAIEEVMDCNYYMASSRRYVCIREMPVVECQMLFSMPGLYPEETCVCDQPDREATQVSGTGYVQYDCQ